MQIKNTVKLLCLLLIVLSSSCVTSSINSIKSEKFDGPYERVYVVLNTSESATAFSNHIAHLVKKEFDLRGVANEFYLRRKLSLDTEKTIQDKINQFNPQVLLVINQTESMVYAGIGRTTGSNSGTFDVQLFKENMDNLIWRAEWKAYGDYGIETATLSAAKKLIEKLEEDKIITPNIKEEKTKK